MNIYAGELGLWETIGFELRNSVFELAGETWFSSFWGSFLSHFKLISI
jgi:hypothetical protein